MRCECCNFRTASYWRDGFYCEECRQEIKSMLDSAVKPEEEDDKYLIKKEWDDD